MNDILQGQISLGRVQDFMYAEEIDTSIINSNRNESDDVAVKIKNGNFAWTTNDEGTQQDSSNLILKNINMEIKKGSFVAILGEYFFFSL